MIAHKLVITGTPVRIDRDRIVIRRGDAIETYSTRYYRWVAEEGGERDEKDAVVPDKSHRLRS